MHIQKTGIRTCLRRHLILLESILLIPLVVALVSSVPKSHIPVRLLPFMDLQEASD